MRLSAFALTALLAWTPLASAQLDHNAKQAGLKYFGTATDTEGQRERAGFQTAYAQYDAIVNNNQEFGQLTPSNGMKVCCISEPP